MEEEVILNKILEDANRQANEILEKAKNEASQIEHDQQEKIWQERENAIT